MHFEPGAGIGEEGKADGVGLGESVEGKGLDGLGDAVLDGDGHGFVRHGGAEFFERFVHALGGAIEAHGSAQLFGLGAAEVGDDHGHLEHLLLEQGDTEGATEHGLEAGMDVVDVLFSIPPIEIGMDHFSDDGTGTDDGDLDDDVIKALRLHARQRGHLRTALDLENADGISLLEHLVSRCVILWDLREIDGPTACGAGGEGLLNDGHHAKAEEIDLDDAEVLAVVLVPLDHDATRHGGRLQRDDGVETGRAKDHAAAVLPEVSRQAVCLTIELKQGREAGMFIRQSCLTDLIFHRDGVGEITAGVKVGEALNDIDGEV